ncbi:MAG TPA: hypothetical protein ENJ80_10130 [Gammaproteobacteria bacterium]|nr:hypothetical protein [Gammaproteobacteria bacterium]
MRSDPISRRSIIAGLLLVQLLPCTPVFADEVEKILFLVVEKRDVVASNTRAGRFDRLEMHAKETVRDYKVANATAVVITNQRFSAYGAQAGGWQSKRRQAGEKVQSIEVADYSATLVTNDRILNFYGRSGTWSEIRRGVQ